jgi:hypothetical protein
MSQSPKCLGFKKCPVNLHFKFIHFVKFNLFLIYQWYYFQTVEDR